MLPNQRLSVVIRAIEPYGLWCECGSYSILVLLPDTDAMPKQPLAEKYKVGEEIEVTIILQNETNGVYRGRIV